MDTKAGTLEESILGVWQDAVDDIELDESEGQPVPRDKDGKLVAKTGFKRVLSKKGYIYKRDTGKPVTVGGGGMSGRDNTGGIGVREGLENSPNPANSQHMCAKNVVHEEWGFGKTVPTMHDEPDAEGNIAWYDVMFEHGIEEKVSVDVLEIKEMKMHSHYDPKKKGHDKKMEDNSNDDSDDGEGMDKVQPKALKKKFKDRKDKDIDNDGDVDSSDEYIDNKRKAISKSMKERWTEAVLKVKENENGEDPSDEDDDDEKKSKGKKAKIEINPEIEVENKKK